MVASSDSRNSLLILQSRLSKNVAMEGSGRQKQRWKAAADGQRKAAADAQAQQAHRRLSMMAASVARDGVHTAAAAAPPQARRLSTMAAAAAAEARRTSEAADGRGATIKQLIEAAARGENEEWQQRVRAASAAFEQHTREWRDQVRRPPAHS